ncbi:GSCFA domain-containing protein [Thalassospira sp. MA62]|nr:GSCFA domain-containing protein [Thalassospira sp. MA62]
MASPYENLGSERFWRHGVADANPRKMANIHRPGWKISETDTIVTMGSCFAQHIAAVLREQGLNVPFFDTIENLKSQTYSANYGNIYTVSQALQLIEEVSGARPQLHEFWPLEDGFIDAVRPNVFEHPVKSKEELSQLRTTHLEAVGKAFKELDVLIFTLGLTEAWIIENSGRTLPVAPGVLAGEFDPAQHTFHNFTHGEILSDLGALCDAITSLRQGKGFKLILTVSPVPLTATYEDQHVLKSTTYSKAVLRVVAEEFARENEFADYFPSFELINNPAAKSEFFESNMRSVRPQAVDVVMSHFLSAYFPGLKGQTSESQPPVSALPKSLAADCEEEMIKGYAHEKNINAFERDDLTVMFGDSHLTSVHQNMTERPEAASFAFAPIRLLANNPGQEMGVHGFRTFIFKKEHSNFRDFFVQDPQDLVVVGMGFFGDNIIRAHGDMRPEAEQRPREQLTPQLPHVTEVTTELVRFYALKLQNQISVAARLEKFTAYKRLFWIVSPDMPENTGRFRLGDEFVDGGFYKIHKAAYKIAFDMWENKLERTKFIQHPWDQLCADNGFTKDDYFNGYPGNIHCTPEFYNPALDILMQLRRL